MIASQVSRKLGPIIGNVFSTINESLSGVWGVGDSLLGLDCKYYDTLIKQQEHLIGSVLLLLMSK